MRDDPFSDAGTQDGADREQHTGSNTTTSWFGKLFDGDADGPPLAELERDYDLPREICIVLRGVLRTASGSGVPPVAEILLGIIIYVVSSNELAQDDNAESVNIDGLPGDLDG